MFIRIVKLSIQPDKQEQFESLFNRFKGEIRNQKGCSGLKLLKDKSGDSVFFTYSIWDEQQSLENYRNSKLFESVWAETKSYFSAKAEAWSTDVLFEL